MEGSFVNPRGVAILRVAAEAGGVEAAAVDDAAFVFGEWGDAEGAAAAQAAEDCLGGRMRGIPDAVVRVVAGGVAH